MRGKVLVRITEWENPGKVNSRANFEAEIFPFNGEIIATAPTLPGILKKLAGQKVQKRIDKERDTINDND